MNVMSNSEEIMRSFNHNALIAPDEDGRICFIEDVADPDGRLYRIEVQSTQDGSQAIAFCRSNPWGYLNGGESYDRGHVDENGFLCIGCEHRGQNLEDSSYDVRYAIQRARYWCTGFTVLKQTGSFPDP